jgi:exodeoxyribonuclease V alpha subunit
VETVEVEVPKDVMGIRNYLDRHFKFIGPVTAGKLVEVFGEDLFRVIESNPEALVGIPGITMDRSMEIHGEYLEIKNDQEHDIFFASNGITMNLKNRLVDRYNSKARAIEVIKENPYVLADEVWGVGFKRADAVAMVMGIRPDSRRRAVAGVGWLLNEASQGEGHCYLPYRELLNRANGIMGTPEATIEGAVKAGIDAGRLVATTEGNVYRKPLFDAERSVAARLRKLVSSYHKTVFHNLTESDLSELDSDQRSALEHAIGNKISIITGGPGAGKTHTLKYILKALGNREIELAAPTGKAAKRMTEATGREARTIHRLLGYSPTMGGFTIDANNPIEADMVVIDESSMIDIKLMASLLDAIESNTGVLFVGDSDQLPSVGPGRVFADMIESEILPVSRLTFLHRQSEKSMINVNAKAVNAGRKIQLEGFDADFQFFPEEDSEKIPELIVRAIQRIPGRFGIPSDGIQVLCPQKRSAIGTKNLNDILRPVLNPRATSGKLDGTWFVEGDRVIQTRNNYDLEIFNGDIGIIEGADKDNLIVAFDDVRSKRVIAYPRCDSDDLQLAYALTIHKSQGSEFPCVIIPVHNRNHIMLKRNLLYTGITRGKKLVILIGQMKAVNHATRTIDSSKRYSNLQQLIKDGV